MKSSGHKEMKDAKGAQTAIIDTSHLAVLIEILRVFDKTTMYFSCFREEIWMRPVAVH